MTYSADWPAFGSMEVPLTRSLPASNSAAPTRTFSATSWEAFSRPTKPSQPHPAPWHALNGGGVAFDVETEVFLRADTRLGLFDPPRIPLARDSTHQVAVRSPDLHALGIYKAVCRHSRGGDEAMIWAVETHPPNGRWEVKVDEEFVRGVQACADNAAQPTRSSVLELSRPLTGAALAPIPCYAVDSPLDLNGNSDAARLQSNHKAPG